MNIQFMNIKFVIVDKKWICLLALNTDELFSLPENALVEQKTCLSLGQQAVSLRDTIDRLKALRRVTSTAQILLAYSMVMKALSQTASRCRIKTKHAVFHLCDIFPDLKRHFCSCLCSASMCSHSNGLESLGLADIRILVRLMTLAAGGRAHTCVDRQSCLTGLATDRHNTSCLRFLTSAIGSVISQSSTAYRQLVEICTQVSLDESSTTRVSY